MQKTVRTVVTFETDLFNVSDPRDYFINDCCFGDDLCKWLAEKLTASGYKVDEEPGQEDFGWYLDFTVADRKYCFVCGYRPGDQTENGCWLGWVERDAGFFASLFGARDKGIAEEGPQAIHQVLSASSDIRTIKWHHKTDFDKNDESKGADSPIA